MPSPILTRERFIERYGRFFGSQRMATIQNLGYLLVEAWGEGPYIFDAEGSRYLDLWNVGGVNSLGHRPPAVVRAMEEATRSQDYGSLFFFSEAKGQLAEALARTTPGRLEAALMRGRTPHVMRVLPDRHGNERPISYVNTSRNGESRA